MVHGRKWVEKPWSTWTSCQDNFCACVCAASDRIKQLTNQCTMLPKTPSTEPETSFEALVVKWNHQFHECDISWKWLWMWPHRAGTHRNRLPVETTATVQRGFQSTWLCLALKHMTASLGMASTNKQSCSLNYYSKYTSRVCRTGKMQQYK